MILYSSNKLQQHTLAYSTLQHICVRKVEHELLSTAWQKEEKIFLNFLSLISFYMKHKPNAHCKGWFKKKKEIDLGNYKAD